MITICYGLYTNYSLHTYILKKMYVRLLNILYTAKYKNYYYYYYSLSLSLSFFVFLAKTYTGATSETPESTEFLPKFLIGL